MAASGPGNGEGSSRASPTEGTLGDVLRAPSAAPDVVVLERMPEGVEVQEVQLDPKEDLWLTTADGRYSSPVIPVHVGSAPHSELFHVHRSVLLRSEWFRKALCGGFMEATAQTLDLPEEEPAIFHFLVAYLYENTYVPTKALSTVLVDDEDKGKGPGPEGDDDSSTDGESDSSSTTSTISNTSARSRQRRERHRLRVERETERLRQKHPGMHRPQCNCPSCHVSLRPCYSCGFTTRVQQPHILPPPPPVVISHRHRRRGPNGHVLPRLPSPPPPAPHDAARIKGEDMRTWLMEYELNIDVYICANKFLLDDFKLKVARSTIDMLETAGTDAATIEVLELCTKLYDGVSDKDPLLKMVFARVGFLQTTLWRTTPVETNTFLIENPEVGALVLKEMALRGEGDLRGAIPSMERHLLGRPPPMMVATHPYPPYRGHPIRHR